MPDRSARDTGPAEVTPEEFIRRRPEVSPDQGSGAGPGAPETVEPTQGQRPGAEDREERS